MERKNVVLILGAGSSKDFGLPLGNEFFSSAHDIVKDDIKGEAGTPLEMTLNEVERNMRLIFTNLPNDKTNYPPFEEVLTFIWDYRKNETFDSKSMKYNSFFGENGAAAVFADFVKMMGLTIARRMSSWHFGDKQSAYKKFVKSLLSDMGRISFVSLNYDLILDSILQDCVDEGILKDYNYGLPLINVKQESCRSEGVLLLKPHGSLNLSFCHHAHNHGFHYHDDNIFTAIFNKREYLKCPICERLYGRADYLEPLIIPPLYNKTSYLKKEGEIAQSNKPLLTWQGSTAIYKEAVDSKIVEVLRDTDEIVVIGYSMPAYDFDFKGLLIKGLMTNRKRENVHIRVITKGDEQARKVIDAQYRHLAGSVTIEAANGFEDYMRTTGFF